jgi:hypothetical protein
VEDTIKPDQKHKTQEKHPDRAKGDLGARKVDAAHAEQVRGGIIRRLRDDENPKE